MMAQLWRQRLAIVLGATALLVAALAGVAHGAGKKAAPATTGRATAHKAMIVVKVARPEEARKTILAALATHGGYPMLVTEDKLELKVPPKGLDALLEAITATGVVLDKARTRADHTEEIKRLVARLDGRRDLLSRLRLFLDEADVNATVRIESQMLGLVVEAERLAGQLRVAEDAVAFARVTVSFTWRQSAPMRYVRSPFPWLESVGLDQLLGGFGR